nr:competence protein ComK [Paraliobacillus sediminis]
MTQDTLAITPAKQIDYTTRIIEKNQTLMTRQAPLAIIKTNCLTGAASYQGRRKAASHLVGYIHKVPLLIYERTNIYAFPTQSPTNYACSWLFAQHILKIVRHPDTNQSTITFHNGTTLNLEESTYQLRTQLNRTIQLHYAIKHHNSHPFETV